MKQEIINCRSIVGDILLGAIISFSGIGVNGQTHSDFNPQFKFGETNTWAFANDKINVRDKFGQNEIWDNYLREDITAELGKAGFRYSEPSPDLIVKYRLGTHEKKNVHVIRNEWPGYVNRRGRWVYWRGGWGSKTIFRTPYDQSTLIVDIVDARTNDLVWRGYDRRALDSKSEKSIRKFAEKLMGQFAKDVRKSRKGTS